MEYIADDDPALGFLPHLYFARMDVEIEGREAFNDWYRDKHAPDLISAGFYSTHGYHCLDGTPFVCNLYEIQSSEIFYSSDYQQKRTPEHDPQRPAILETVTNRSNTAYEQVSVMAASRPEASWAQGDRRCAVEGEAISTIRFDVDNEAHVALGDWVSVQMRAGAFSRPGVVAVRLCRRSGRPHPANPSSEPQWVLVTEWDSTESGLAGQSSSEEVARLDAAPMGVSAVAYNFAVRNLSLTDARS